MDIGSYRYAKHRLDGPYIAHHNVTILNQFGHDLQRFLPEFPELRAVVQVDGNDDAFFGGDLQRFFANIGYILIDGRAYRAEMEPAYAPKFPFPIDDAGF